MLTDCYKFEINLKISLDKQIIVLKINQLELNLYIKSTYFVDFISKTV